MTCITSSGRLCSTERNERFARRYQFLNHAVVAQGIERPTVDREDEGSRPFFRARQLVAFLTLLRPDGGHAVKNRIIAGVVTLVALVSISGCSLFEKEVDDFFRILGSTPGTFLNYGADGQVVFEAKCRSMHFERDTEYDVYSTDSDDTRKMIEPSSVVKVSCGDNLINTVGFTSVYISDGAKASLAANSQQFYDVRVKNNDRGIPLINYIWRDVKNLFVGTSRVAQICDQNNNPILAFAADGVTGHATDVAKSTLFKIDTKGNKPDGYVWISRGSYTVLDTDLLG